LKGRCCGVSKLTKKQKRFVGEYLVDLNATQAAIRAGYSGKTASVIGAENLIKPNVKFAIDSALEKIRNERLATAYEVEAYLTAVLRGESKSEIVVMEGMGDGCSQARHIQKSPDEKERLKAAEILAKRHGLTDSKLKLEGAVSVSFGGENNLE